MEEIKEHIWRLNMAEVQELKKFIAKVEANLKERERLIKLLWPK